MTTKQIIIAIVLLVVFFPAAIVYVISALSQNKSKKQQEEHYRQLDAEVENRKQAFANWRQSYIAQHGIPDKEITPSLNKDDAIFAHEATKQIFIQGKMYPFADILSYEIEEIKFSADGTQTIKTKVNTKSLLGRAAVGAVIAGPLGAMVGGATASSTSTVRTSGGYSDTYYDVNVKVRNIATPTIKIEAYSKESAQEIAGLLEAVIASK